MLHSPQALLACLLCQRVAKRVAQGDAQNKMETRSHHMQLRFVEMLEFATDQASSRSVSHFVVTCSLTI